jgi:hypothetical protein
MAVCNVLVAFLRQWMPGGTRRQMAWGQALWWLGPVCRNGEQPRHTVALTEVIVTFRSATWASCSKEPSSAVGPLWTPCHDQKQYSLSTASGGH